MATLRSSRLQPVLSLSTYWMWIGTAGQSRFRWVGKYKLATRQMRQCFTKDGRPSGCRREDKGGNVRFFSHFVYHVSRLNRRKSHLNRDDSHLNQGNSHLNHPVLNVNYDDWRVNCHDLNLNRYVLRLKWADLSVKCLDLSVNHDDSSVIRLDLSVNQLDVNVNQGDSSGGCNVFGDGYA